MAEPLSRFERLLKVSLEERQRSLNYPVLLWEAPVPSAEGSYETDTAAGSGKTGGGKALVFKLRRRLGKLAAVGSNKAGITVGRIDTNDVVIPESSVSRFHASFLEDVQTGAWMLRDVGSKNGTWIGPVKLEPGAEEPMADRVRVRFGGIDLFFLLPESFFQYLRQTLGESS